MTVELIALTKELHATTAMLGRVITRLDAADQRANRHRAWTAILALCVAAVFVLAAWTYEAASDSQTALDELASSRLEARINSCETANVDVVDRINGILLTLASSSSDPEAARERVEPLLLPHRDCSPAGIEAYFDDSDETDPYLPVTIP